MKKKIVFLLLLTSLPAMGKGDGKRNPYGGQPTPLPSRLEIVQSNLPRIKPDCICFCQASPTPLPTATIYPDPRKTGYSTELSGQL